MSQSLTSDFLPGKRHISLENELHGRTLTTRVRFSRDIRRFFRSNSFALRYSDEIHAGDGLLSIPGLALLLPVAWLAGANVSVKRLDRTYAQAADSLQRGYRDMYPGMSCGIRLEADEVVDSPSNPDGAALFFSGGLKRPIHSSRTGILIRTCCRYTAPSFPALREASWKGSKRNLRILHRGMG